MHSIQYPSFPPLLISLDFHLVTLVVCSSLISYHPLFQETIPLTFQKSECISQWLRIKLQTMTSFLLWKSVPLIFAVLTSFTQDGKSPILKVSFCMFCPDFPFSLSLPSLSLSLLLFSLCSYLFICLSFSLTVSHSYMFSHVGFYLCSVKIEALETNQFLLHDDHPLRCLIEFKALCDYMSVNFFFHGSQRDAFLLFLTDLGRLK